MILAEQNKFAVGNGLDRSAGATSCDVGNNPTTERSRPFPTYSIGGCGESCGKILSAPVVILSEAKDLVRATTQGRPYVKDLYHHKWFLPNKTNFP